MSDMPGFDAEKWRKLKKYIQTDQQARDLVSAAGCRPGKVSGENKSGSERVLDVHDEQTGKKVGEVRLRGR